MNIFLLMRDFHFCNQNVMFRRLCLEKGLLRDRVKDDTISEVLKKSTTLIRLLTVMGT